MAKLDLTCPCGFQQSFNCLLDDNARHLAQMHGWNLVHGQFLCPDCGRKWNEQNMAEQPKPTTPAPSTPQANARLMAEKQRRAEQQKTENRVVKK